MTVHPTPRNLIRQMWPKAQPRTKTKPPCAVEGCGDKVLARGWCSMHYARWRNTGSTDPYRQPTEHCGVEGCESSPRSTYAEYCEKHYYRLRRTGATADPTRVSGPCLVMNCEKDAMSRIGYCEMHYKRLKKRGDVEFEYKRESVRYWTGDDATYSAAHQRVKKWRGRASTHKCSDCGGRARHWSYDRTDPNEKFEEGRGPYSTDLDRYQPRCVRCHKRFDMAFVMQRRRVSEKKVRQIVAARSGGQCERCSGRGHSLHHLKNRSQGGGWSPANCVWLCGDGVRGCHGWATSHPAAAWDEGFHVRPWETPGMRPVLYRGRWVLLDDAGAVSPIGGDA